MLQLNEVLSLSDPSAASADQIASDAADAFAAASRGEYVVQNVMLGLDRVLELTRHPGMLSMTKSIVENLEQAIIKAGPVLAEQDECKSSNMHHVLGMIGTLATVSLFGKTKEEITASTSLPLVLDYTDYASLLMAELVVQSVKKRIEDRGKVLQAAMKGRATSNSSLKPTSAIH